MRRLALLALLLVAMAAQAERPPNLILILVDDLGKEWISAYGAQDIETPHIDALAASGMRFENAWSMPQCTPSRITLLTGQYPWRTGWVNHWDVPRWGVGYFDWELHTTLPQLLRDAGYATAAAGKWQVNDFRIEPAAMRKHGFDDWCMWTGYETGNPPSANRFWDAYINTPDGSKTYDDTFGPDIYADYLIRFLEQHREEPVFLYFPMALTHTPFTTTPDDREAKGKLAQHKAMVRYTDRLVGRIVSAVDDLGLRNDTVIVFTTDNGSTGGITGTRNGRNVSGAKGRKSEPGVCQPFIVSAPGRVPSGSVTSALTDFTDLLPTFLDLAGATQPDSPLDGASIAPVLRGESDTGPREWIMALGHGPAVRDTLGVRGKQAYASRVLRDDRYKAWVNESREVHQLYDLIADPHEEHNLLESDTPEHAAALANFRALIDQMPHQDARPAYRPRAPQPWDKPVNK